MKVPPHCTMCKEPQPLYSMYYTTIDGKDCPVCSSCKNLKRPKTKQRTLTMENEELEQRMESLADYEIPSITARLERIEHGQAVLARVIAAILEISDVHEVSRCPVVKNTALVEDIDTIINNDPYEEGD